jgi:hypothetical protein
MGLRLRRRSAALASAKGEQMGDQERKMGLNDLMSRLGNADHGSIARPPLEAEYERRKFIWQRVAVIIAAIGVMVAIFGVTIAGVNLIGNRSAHQSGAGK